MKHLQLYFWDNYLEFSIAHVIIRLLLDQIFLPLEITVLLNLIFISLVEIT